MKTRSVSPKLDINNYKTIPALAVYLDRIAREQSAVVDQRNFKKFALQRDEGRYKKDRVTIMLASDGTVTCHDAAFKPTDKEAAKIKAAFKKIKFPASVPTTRSRSDKQRRKLGARDEDWFEIFDGSARDQVVMCQQRIDKEDGGKLYISWTDFPDGEWRSMEPDGLLPMWKPPASRNKVRIMMHEGAKVARHVDWLINDPEAREARATHPWAIDLADYEHWGWIGGAPNPHRTNWSELSIAKPIEVVIVADNDLIGKQAIVPIARALSFLSVPVLAVMFDDGFMPSFDLANVFPKRFWIKERYRGPSLVDSSRSATWATLAIAKTKGEGAGAPQHVARTAFLTQWVYSILPPVFVHLRNPNRLLDESQFNAAMSPFSDVRNTAEILRREAVAQVDSVAYEPGRNSGIVTMGGQRLINTWTPTRIQRRSGDETMWNKFMEHLFPVKIDRENVLRWVATLVARPDVRMKYGLLLISETQGVGKGTLMEKILAPLVGWQNVSVPSEKQLTESGFNSWLVRRRLVLVHEIYAGHSKKAYDSIKSYVTDDTLTVNEKNKPEYEINNWTHFVLSSNSVLALRLVKGDRRWAVPEVTEKKREASYWLELNAWLISGGLEVVHDWAHVYVAEHDAIGAGDEAPISDAKNRLIELSRSEGMQMVLDLGDTAVKFETEVVLTDRAVRGWLQDARSMRDNDPHLESLLTVRSMLLQAGMTEAQTYKIKGVRFVAFANPKVKSGVDWEVLKGKIKAPKDLIAEAAAEEAKAATSTSTSKAKVKAA